MAKGKSMKKEVKKKPKKVASLKGKKKVGVYGLV